MHSSLKGKHIVVFGAGGLLGSSLVKYLLDKEAQVTAVDINEVSTLERIKALKVGTSTPMLSVQAVDVTDELQVKGFFSQALRIDGVVNAAYPRNKSYGSKFFDVTLKSFNENLSLHLGSAFILTQQAAAFFKRNLQPLSLVNISSIYGVVAPKFDVYDNTSMTMPVEYAAIKAAIQHLNKYVVSYVKDSRFRVNCVSPGGILDGQPDMFLSAYQAHTHGQGMLKVDEVLGSIGYLLSDGSKFVTGQNIIVDDGFSL
tara:strand:+ start:4489 stop:5259 length:771 start_codon:yes stop_codon:yes gene_type:complete